jgi:hypothetical protein
MKFCSARGLQLGSLLSGILLTGCYSQQPLGLGVPAPATRIIAQVTDTGMVAMGNAIGSGAVEVEGIISQADATAWRLHLIRVDHRGGTSTLWNREEVSFPRQALTNIREKKLSKKKSWLAAGAVSAGVFILSRLFGSVLGGDSDDREPPPPF